MTPNYTGDPGEYDVVATALDGYVLSNNSQTEWNDLVVEDQDDPQNCVTNPDVKKVWVCKYVGKSLVAEIQTILDANRPAKPAGARPARGAKPAGARPSNTKLVAALANGLDIDEATVKAAFAKIEAAQKAEHTARAATMYAALAKELGLTHRRRAGRIRGQPPGEAGETRRVAVSPTASIPQHPRPAILVAGRRRAINPRSAPAQP